MRRAFVLFPGELLTDRRRRSDFHRRRTAAGGKFAPRTIRANAIRQIPLQSGASHAYFGSFAHCVQAIRRSHSFLGRDHSIGASLRPRLSPCSTSIASPWDVLFTEREPAANLCRWCEQWTIGRDRLDAGPPDSRSTFHWTIFITNPVCSRSDPVFPFPPHPRPQSRGDDLRAKEPPTTILRDGTTRMRLPASFSGR